MASAKIYTGAWIDHSKSTLLAPTLTVTTAQALILISFLAVFIVIIGAHLWGLVRYTLHQLRCSTAPQDAMYHQEQAILRNSATPAGAVWELVKLGFAWKKRPGYGFRRVVPLLCIAALQAAFFALAGVFSSGVLGGSSVVLVKSDSCGYVDMPGVEVESKDPIAVARLGAAIAERKIAAEASAAYARACYGNSSADVDCNSFVIPRLPASFEWVACPFDNTTCLDGALKADTGFIYTDDDLGINSAKQDSLAYRRVTTCAPIRTEGYSTWRTNSEGAEQYLDLLYNSRSTGVTKRQLYTYDKEGDVDIDEVDIDDEDEDDDEDDVAEEFLPVDDSYDQEVADDVADDEVVSDERLTEEQATPADNDAEIEDGLTEDDVQLEDSTVDEPAESEDSAVENSTVDDSLDDDDLPLEDSTVDETVADDRTDLAESEPEQTEDETLEDGTVDEDAVDKEFDDTHVDTASDDTEILNEDSTAEDSADDETTEFEEATTAETRPDATSVIGNTLPTATQAPGTSQQDADLMTANHTTNWLDEPVDENNNYSYTDENGVSSFDETEASTVMNTAPITFTYDKNSAAYITTAYPIDYRFSSLGDSASSSFKPISDLASIDADVTIIILTKNAKYVQAVDDIWFNATEVATDNSGFSTLDYTSADPVAVMACTEQHQLCDPTMPESTGCSPLTGWAAVQAAQRYSGARVSVVDDLSHAVSNSLISSMLAQLGPSALLASLSIADAESLHSAALPDNQWQLEVEAWTSYNLAHLQRLVASVATGPALISSAAYITTPSESMSTSEETNETTTFSVCANQKILDANHHSFPIFHLSLTIAIGCVIILLNLFLTPLVALFQTLTGFGVSRKQAWEGDHLFQLQRVAYEGANLGTWNGSAKGAHVPTTVYSVVPERFGRPGVKGVYEAVDNDGDASGVYDENSMSDDEDVEKAAYGDGGKGYVEKAKGARKSVDSDRTSLAEEDLVPGRSVYRDADNFGRGGVDMGVKLEEDSEDQRKKKW